MSGRYLETFGRFHVYLVGLRERRMAVTSVVAYDQGHHSECLLAEKLIRCGRASLDKRAWRPAKSAFSTAARISAARLPEVADCYAAAGDAARTRRAALHCHRQAKHFYKQIAPQKRAARLLLPSPSPSPSPSPPSPPALGLMWQSLGTQYSKLARLKDHSAHANRRALSSFTRALDHAASADRPAAYRGRLDAATYWLAKKRRCMWFGRKQRQRDLRALAWEDALMLLRTPSWSAPSTSSWEAVADLCAVCDDDASARSIQRDVLPLLETALCEPSCGLGHGNPWHATLALLTHRKDDVEAILAVIRRAVRLQQVNAQQLPLVLSCYDSILALEPLAALAAVDDLSHLRDRFCAEHHSLGKLVFTAGRFLESAQAYEDKAAADTALGIIADIAMQTAGCDTVDLAVTMLGYLAKRQPDVGAACVAHLQALGLARGLTGQHALLSDIIATLAPCTQEPVAAPVREAARAAIACLDAAQKTRLHAR